MSKQIVTILAKVSALNSMIKNDLIWKFTFDFTALFFDKLVTEGLVTQNVNLMSGTPKVILVHAEKIPRPIW